MSRSSRRQILHITPHMGGGVGKAVSSLIRQAASSRPGDEHVVVCLEKPVKSKFVDEAEKAGGRFVFQPEQHQFSRHIANADIVQLEFWNHPAIIKYLCAEESFSMRLLIWCHISGLHFPIIPEGLIERAEYFLLTSACSYASPEITAIPTIVREKLAVISSGGIDDLPSMGARSYAGSPSYGYMGTLNFSKLHPGYVDFVSAIRDQNLRIDMYGDETNRDLLDKHCKALGRPDLLSFHGYANDVAETLSGLDLFIYLLNPYHYGTAENALIEAMAMGVVPIVLNNPCEQAIVKAGVNGTVIKDASELADAVETIGQSPELRRHMGEAAVDDVRTKFTFRHAESQFSDKYREMMDREKKPISFVNIFGKNPAQAMSKFYREFSVMTDSSLFERADPLSRYAFTERTKGSVFHFLDYFPENRELMEIAHHTRNCMRVAGVQSD